MPITTINSADMPRARVPTDLPSDPRKAYLRGWHDRTRLIAGIAGRATSEAKAEAARANGAKGGRPPKAKGKR